MNRTLLPEPSNCRESLSMSDKQRRGWDIIEDIIPFVHSIGRIPLKGSVLLLSLPVPQNSFTDGTSAHSNHGILITTTFALRSESECESAVAAFLEDPVAGSSAKRLVRPTRVNLKPSTAYFSSASEDDLFFGNIERGDVVGYTIVACDIEDEKDKTLNLRSIMPLALPLTPPGIAINKGDEHLIVTHIEGRERRYIVGFVDVVHKTYCTYQHPRSHESVFASGGAVFSRGGVFIGVPHQNGTNSYCLFASEIVKHLFFSGMLGVCRIPISESAEVDAGVKLGSATVSNGSTIDVGCGDHVMDFNELKLVQLKRERQEKPSANCMPTVDRVWSVWNTSYVSLIMMLHAFPYQRTLVNRVLRELCSHENRSHIESVAKEGGIGIILEICDSYPHDDVVLLGAITAIARMSMYSSNKDAIARCDGVAVILTILRMNAASPAIQQWGVYSLMNLIHDSAKAVENVSRVTRGGGIEHALRMLDTHSSHEHIVRWCSMLLAYAVTLDEKLADIIFATPNFELLLALLVRYRSEAYPSVGLMFLCSRMPSPHGEGFLQWGGIPFVVQMVTGHIHSADPQILRYAVETLRWIAQRHPTRMLEMKRNDVEATLRQALAAHQSDVELARAASDVMVMLARGTAD